MMQSETAKEINRTRGGVRQKKNSREETTKDVTFYILLQSGNEYLLFIIQTEFFPVDLWTKRGPYTMT